MFLGVLFGSVNLILSNTTNRDFMITLTCSTTCTLTLLRSARSQKSLQNRVRTVSSPVLQLALNRWRPVKQTTLRDVFIEQTHHFGIHSFVSNPNNHFRSSKFLSFCLVQPAQEWSGGTPAGPQALIRQDFTACCKAHSSK